MIKKPLRLEPLDSSPNSIWDSERPPMKMPDISIILKSHQREEKIQSK